MTPRFVEAVPTVAAELSYAHVLKVTTPWLDAQQESQAYRKKVRPSQCTLTSRNARNECFEADTRVASGPDATVWLMGHAHLTAEVVVVGLHLQG